MATVRMTRDLRQSIIENIKKMFHTRSEKAMEQVQLEMQKLQEEIRLYLFPREIVQELCDPKFRDYVLLKNAIDFNVKANGKTYTFNLQFVGGMLPVKFDASSYYLHVKQYWIPEDAPMYPKVKAILDPLHQIENDCNELVGQIQDLLDEAPSLKRLLEVWPSALDFVPKKYVDRHNQPVVYAKREKVEIAMDIETKANLLKARMGNV